MKMLDIVNGLRLNGLLVFRVNDVARLTGKSKAYVYLQLSKSRMVRRAQNGVYYLDDADPLLVASSIVTPSYISLVSAFSHYGLIDQVPRVIKVVTTKRHRAIPNIHNMVVDFRSVRPGMMYGYSSTRGIAIAEIEKAVVDSLYLNEDTRYLPEVARNGVAAGSFSSSALAAYARRCGVKSVAAAARGLARAVA